MHVTFKGDFSTAQLGRLAHWFAAETLIAFHGLLLPHFLLALFLLLHLLGLFLVVLGHLNLLYECKKAPSLSTGGPLASPLREPSGILVI